jgi:hypothetical protein
VRPRAEPQFFGGDLANLGLNTQEVGMFRRKERNGMQETAALSANK